tara:strand:+ start:1327 stop:1596 length:270 start_codon:yes stop_codon:yes gene_type:complete
VGVYSLFSAIGIAPQVAFFTYIGSIISNLPEFQEKAKSNLILLIIGIMSTIGMLVYMAMRSNEVIKDLQKKKNNNGQTMLEVNDSDIAV